MAPVQPQELVEAALASSRADGCVAIDVEQSSANLRWAGNGLTTNGQASSRELTVVSVFERSGGASVGVVSRSVASVDEVDELVRAADRAASDAGPAEDAMPLVGSGADVASRDEGWDDDPGATGIGIFDDFARSLARQFDQWGRAERALFGFAEHQLSSTYLGSSTGLRRRFDQPDGRLELNGKSADLSRSAWSGQHTRDFTDVDVAAAADALEQRLSWAAERIELPAGRYETILPPTAVADLLIYAYWTASARDADEGRSVFSAPDGGSRIGERLSALPLTLRSDPFEPGLQCAPFEIATSSYGGVQSVFDNGQPVTAVEWIRDGVLAELVRTRSWAARSSSTPRPFVGNLVLDGAGTAGIDEMVASTERGLLLTCLWYIREVDPQTLLVTGLTRDGVYLVEDGTVRGAVNNFRFNESPIELLSRAIEVGRSVPAMSREWNDDFRRTAMPALRIPDFAMSSVSQAF